MHFINRESFTEAPVKKLAEFNEKKKQEWANYNSARISNLKPLPSRPPSLWLHDDIRSPLKKLFLKNCGYCGIHADQGRDAEVDHFHPTSKDENADFVFDWNNYIWSCPACNGMKSNEFPFLNPTSIDDTKHIYFNNSDGRYLLYRNAPESIISKYKLTDDKSNLNDKNRPARRKCLAQEVNRNLKEIRLCNLMYETEKSISGNNSNDTNTKLKKLIEKKSAFIDLIKSGDYLFLVASLVEEFISKREGFPYTFEELLIESKYLEN